MTTEAQDVAARMLELVRAIDSGAEAEVVVDHNDLALTRFANSFIHQNVAESTTTVRLRVHLGGRTATGSSTVAGEGLAALVDRTVAAARLSPPDPLWPGLAAPAPVPPAQPPDAETVAADPQARAARVAAFVAAAGGLETAGYCRTLHRSVTFANSTGQWASAELTEAAMDAIARVGRCDGVARTAGPRLSAIDGGRLGARAAAKARAAVDPVELAPGDYEVVLESGAVYDIVDLMGSFGFNGRSVADQQSFVVLGAGQLDPHLSLVDDPFDPDGSSLPFDLEGTPRQSLTLVAAGVCAAVAHDRRTAAMAGTRSTGHAAEPESDRPTPANLVLQASGTPAPEREVAEVDGPAADASVAELVAQVERGLLVTDSWYTRLLDPRALVVTGLTRNGVWRIEDGQIGPAVQNLRFTQAYPAALGPGAVLGVGRHLSAVPPNWGTGCYRVPALRLASWHYTGNAAG